MANISVVVQDANNIQLNLTPAPATTLIAEGGNNVTLELTPTPTQVIELDRGVAGNGIESITVVNIDGSEYLRIAFTNGTTSDVGPISTTLYLGVSPIVVTGNQISLSTVPLTLGGTGATTAEAARANLGLGTIATQNANAVAITGGSISGSTLSGDTIGGENPYLDFADGTAVTLSAGRFWYNATTGSWNLGMGNGNITQQIGEELFIYGKASSAITEGQLICKTGTVGASGVITFGPSPTGLTTNDGIIGVATENIALNGFGRINSFGVIHGINTTGSSVGETWLDNDTLYYNPNYVGGLTKVKPSAPYAKFEIGTVINASSGGSGSIQVDLIHGSTLGGTDSNVQINGVSNGNTLIYDATAGYWKNASITAGTGISVTNGAGSISVANTGVTSISGGTTGLTPSTATTGAVTLAGTLAVANGGTGVTTSTGSGSTVLATSPTLVTPLLGTPTSGVLTNCTGYTYANLSGTVPTWNQNTTGTAAGLSATLAITSGGTGATTASAALTSLGAYPSSNPSGYTSNIGTVTSVNASGGTTGLTFSGGPVTTSGTVTLNGTLAIANGGTGQTATNAAFNALAPSQTGNSGKYLTTDGSNTSWAANPLGTVTSVSGAGTVNGLTLTGTVTTSGSLTLGGTLDLSSPPAIGGTAAAAGSFTSLSYTTTLTGGAGIVNLGSGQFYKDASGNVGIGTSSPSTYGANLAVLGSGNGVISVGQGTSYTTFQSNGQDFYLNMKGTGSTIFRNGSGDTERARIDSSGNLLVGKTSGVNKIETVGAGVDGNGTVAVNTSATTIYTIKQASTGAMCVIYGDDGSSGFMDLLFFLSGNTPQVVSSKTIYGSPPARTYTASSTALRCALASGVLNVRTATLSTLSS